MITPAFSLTATERVLPKLALDFTTASLDSRVTFTRTTGVSNPATYISSSGVIVSATDNQPRFDYNNITLVCKGLLIEESRSNTLTYSIPDAGTPTGWSTGFNTGTWTRTLVAGFGVLTGFQDVIKHEQTVSGRSYLVKTLSLAASTTYCVSVYVDVANTTTTNPILSINNFTGASSLDGFSKTKADADATGRVRVIFTTAADTTGEVRLGLGIGGDETGIAIYGGWQLETGAFATSYIPTTSAALTRNADSATITSIRFTPWFNASEGSFMSLINSASGLTNTTVASLEYSNTNFYRQYFSSGVGKLSVRSGGSTVVDIGTESYSGTGAYQMCSSYKVDDFSSASNGANFVTDTSGALPSTPNILRLGLYGTSATYLNGHIAKFSYWPMKLTNAEIVAFSKQG